MNLSKDSPFSEKKEALRFVAQTLIDNNEPDFLLKLRANSTLSALNVDLDPNELAVFVDNEIGDIKKDLKKKVDDQPMPMNIDEGGRRKRRGKKTKKTKKSRRYTRRR